jgi:hypothetical protein
MTTAAPLPRFGVVAEGVTDQAVLKNILIGAFTEEGEEPDVRPIQPPPRDARKDTADPPGGWSLVFRFFTAGEHRKALQTVDYLVIHIDTDVSEQAGYDVPWREAGRELTVDELAARVAAKIEGLIGPDLLAAHGHRFLFALAVHSIECWLLPLLYDDNRSAKISGCLAAANEARRRRNEAPLSKPVRGGESKDHRAYDSVSRPYLKRKRLVQGGEKNRSLGIFLEKLAAVVPRTASVATDVEPAAPPSSSQPSPPRSDEPPHGR